MSIKEEVIEKVVNFWTAGARDILTDRINERIEVFSKEMGEMSDGEYIHLYSDYGPKHFLRDISKGNIPRMCFPSKARMNVYHDKVMVAGYAQEYRILD